MHTTFSLVVVPTLCQHAYIDIKVWEFNISYNYFNEVSQQNYKISLAPSSIMASRK